LARILIRDRQILIASLRAREYKILEIEYFPASFLLLETDEDIIRVHFIGN